MLSDWLWLVALSALLVVVQSMPTVDDAKKTEQQQQPVRPKGTLSNSGLDDVIETPDNEPQQQQQQQQVVSVEDNQPKALPIANYVMEQQATPQQRDRNYEYGKVLVNEIGDIRGGVWDLPTYGRYYAMSDDDRRKRSNESPLSTSNVAASSTSSPMTHNVQSQHLGLESAAGTGSILGQPKRSLASYYQDSRYKRESDFDPEDFLALLSLYDNERRNRRNWRNYDSDEYENADDESNVIGLDDEDLRSSSWLDQQLAYPQQQQPQHHYLSSDPVLASELAALSRSRPNNYYDQYLAQQYGNNQQPYDSGVQYGTPQYGVPYVQHTYYPPEKRFMVSRKRSQNYDSYGSRSGLMINSRGYPSYQHRLLY